MVTKELHEGPSRGHFAAKITQKKMLDIGDQLCIGMRMIIVNLMMHIQEHEDWQLKVLQVGHKSSKRTIYEKGT
jgi:hypothetical protein